MNDRDRVIDIDACSIQSILDSGLPSPVNAILSQGYTRAFRRDTKELNSL